MRPHQAQVFVSDPPPSQHWACRGALPSVPSEGCSPLGAGSSGSLLGLNCHAMDPRHGWHQKMLDRGLQPSPFSHLKVRVWQLHSTKPAGKPAKGSGLPLVSDSPCLVCKCDLGGLEPPNAMKLPMGSHRRGRRVLTGADSGEVLHVPEESVDGGTGAWVEPIPADAQVELEPTGLRPERQRCCRGR